MQNYEQILQELGVEIPEDKKTELKQKMGENYRTKSDYDKVVEKRDEYKTSLDDVQRQLDSFKDVNVEELQSKIATLTQQLDDEKAEQAKKAARAELEKTIDAFLATTVEENGKKRRKYEFMNDITEDHYRGKLIEELEKDSAKGKSISDIFTGMITGEDGKQKTGIFVDRQEQGRARFAEQMHKGNGGGTGDRKLSGMSLDERIKLKATDPEYYESLKNNR